MEKVITYNKKAYELIPGAVKVQLQEGGKYVEVSADDLLNKKEYEKVAKNLLASALENPRQRRKGYKKNAENQVVDTKGKPYIDTWNKGGSMAYEYEIIYGGIFREVNVESESKKEDSNPEKPE